MTEPHERDVNDNDNDERPGYAGPTTRAGATMSSGAKILGTEEARAFAIRAAQSLVDDKCTEVEVIDVTGLSPVTGFIVIGSGTSARQMRGALEGVRSVAKEAGTECFHISSDDDALWLLADFVDVVVHLFEPNARSHYDLEQLWFEGKRLDIPASELAQRNRGRPS